MSEKKGINTTELTLLIVGSTIGSGVFGITSDLATAAAPGPAIIAWIYSRDRRFDFSPLPN